VIGMDIARWNDGVIVELCTLIAGDSHQTSQVEA